MGDELVPMFMKIGLTEQKAKETAKNKNLSKVLSSVVNDASKESKDLTSYGTLLYHVASKIKPQVFHFTPLLVKYICSGKIDSELRLNAALDFLAKCPPGKTIESLDISSFEDSCGVGVVVTPAQIEEAVEAELAKVGLLKKINLTIRLTCVFLVAVFALSREKNIRDIEGWGRSIELYNH